MNKRTFEILTLLSPLRRDFTGPTLVREWSIKQMPDSTLTHRLLVQSMGLARRTYTQTLACTGPMKRISQPMAVTVLHVLLARSRRLQDPCRARHVQPASTLLS